MKATRVFVGLIITCILFSMWPFTTVLAQEKNELEIITNHSVSGYEVPKIAYVTVENKTGGILYVQLKALQYANEPGRASYNLAFSQQGRIRFTIKPGRFTYTVRSSNCGGRKINTKFFTGDTFLGVYTCDKKSK